MAAHEAVAVAAVDNDSAAGSIVVAEDVSPQGVCLGLAVRLGPVGMAGLEFATLVAARRPRVFGDLVHQEKQ